MSHKATPLTIITAVLAVAYLSFLTGADVGYMATDQDDYQQARADVLGPDDVFNGTQRAEIRMATGMAGGQYLGVIDMLVNIQQKATLSGLWLGWHYGWWGWTLAWAPAIIGLEIAPLLGLTWYRYARRTGRSFRV